MMGQRFLKYHFLNSFSFSLMKILWNCVPGKMSEFSSPQSRNPPHHGTHLPILAGVAGKYKPCTMSCPSSYHGNTTSDFHACSHLVQPSLTYPSVNLKQLFNCHRRVTAHYIGLINSSCSNLSLWGVKKELWVICSFWLPLRILWTWPINTHQQEGGT